MKGYIQQQRERAATILRKSEDLLRKCEGHCERYGLEMEQLSKIRALVKEFHDLNAQAGNLKSVNLPDQSAEISAIHDKMVIRYKEIERHHLCLKEEVRRQIRRLLQPKEQNFVSFINPRENVGAEVMEAHRQTKEREKTRGEGDQEDEKQKDVLVQEDEVIPVNSIISCSNEVIRIMATNDAGVTLPPNTVEHLNILNRSQDLHELRRNLGLSAANLKKRKGEQGRWSFRSNKQYRIRFEITEEGFTNVEVGDFHVRGK